MRYLPAAEVVAEVPDIRFDDDDIVVGVIVLVLVRDGQDLTGLGSYNNDGLDWIHRVGMLQAALDVERADAIYRRFGDQP